MTKSILTWVTNIRTHSAGILPKTNETTRVPKPKESGRSKVYEQLAPIRHEIRQLIALKSLESNATPPDVPMLSERLIAFQRSLNVNYTSKR